MTSSTEFYMDWTDIHSCDVNIIFKQVWDSNIYDIQVMC